jgi:hypothetical protein
MAPIPCVATTTGLGTVAPSEIEMTASGNPSTGSGTMGRSDCSGASSDAEAPERGPAIDRSGRWGANAVGAVWVDGDIGVESLAAVEREHGAVMMRRVVAKPRMTIAVR